MYQRILAAVDGSDTSNLALQEAIRLAKDQSATLRLFHVVDLTMAYSSVEAPHVLEYQKVMEEAGKRVIADCSAAAHAAGIQFDSKCVSMFGRHIYDVIEEAVKEWNADLIVIGTHGRRGVRRLLLGSVAEGFMRVSSKPVLLIRGAQGA